MSVVQSYNPVKIRVIRPDKTLGRLDGDDIVFAYPEDARAYIDAAFDRDGEGQALYARGDSDEPLARSAKFVIIPATVA